MLDRNTKLLSGVLLLGACNSTPAALEGDVYLMTRGGDAKRGASVEVFVAPMTDSLAARLVSVCNGITVKLKAAQRQLDSLELRADSLMRSSDRERERASSSGRFDHAVEYAQLAVEAAKAKRRILDEGFAALESIQLSVRSDSLREIFASSSVAKATTGLSANYRIEGIPPGTYVVHAQWPIADDHHVWLTRVSLRKGEQLRLDLENSKLLSSEFAFCSDGQPNAEVRHVLGVDVDSVATQ